MWNQISVDIPTVVELGRKIMLGEIKPDNIEAPYPMGCIGPLEEVQPGLAFMPFFGNITVLDTSEWIELGRVKKVNGNL